MEAEPDNWTYRTFFPVCTARVAIGGPGYEFEVAGQTQKTNLDLLQDV